MKRWLPLCLLVFPLAAGCGDPAARSLSELQSPSPRAREKAALNLGAMVVPGDSEAVSALVGALGDTSPRVRSQAAHSLVFFHKKVTEDVVAVLVDSLADEDRHARRIALGALYHADPAARDAIPGLLKLLKDDDAPVRATAVFALSAVTPDGDSTPVPMIKLALGDKDPVVRFNAALILAYHWRDPSGLAVLAGRWKSARNDDERSVCLLGLGRLAASEAEEHRKAVEDATGLSAAELVKRGRSAEQGIRDLSDFWGGALGGWLRRR